MRVEAVMVRGGTSRGLFFHERNLPADPTLRDQLILAAYGSPDPYGRQIDGIGGATSTTSKVGIIGDGRAFGVDVTFEFGQVAIDRALIDRHGNCGNLSAAVGPFAVDEGLVKAGENGVTLVKFLNLNTGDIMQAHVPTRDGRFDPVGTYELPGVKGTGSEIRMDFLDPAGSVTGKLLPTGQLTEDLEVAGVGRIEVSIVDAGNPVVFVSWESLGMSGDERPNEIDADVELLARIEAVRAHAAVAAGIADSVEQATREVPSIPKVAVVGPPRSYRATDGRLIEADAMTIRCTMMSMGRTHPSAPVTGAICMTVAAATKGTLPAKLRADSAMSSNECLIGHPAGMLIMTVQMSKNSDGEDVIDAVSCLRTARRIMEGVVIVPDRVLGIADSREPEWLTEHSSTVD